MYESFKTHYLKPLWLNKLAKKIMTKNEYNYYPRSKVEKLITDFVVEHKLDAQFVQQTEGLSYVRFVVEEDEDDE